MDTENVKHLGHVYDGMLSDAHPPNTPTSTPLLYSWLHKGHTASYVALNALDIISRILGCPGNLLPVQECVLPVFLVLTGQ